MSRSVSPLVTLDVCRATLTTSAPSRLPATSNDVRVRVDDSKKTLTTVRPWRTRAFFTSSRGRREPALGAVEDVKDVVARELRDPEQVAVASTSHLVQIALVLGRRALLEHLFEAAGHDAQGRGAGARAPRAACARARPPRARSSTGAAAARGGREATWCARARACPRRAGRRPGRRRARRRPRACPPGRRGRARRTRS